LLLIASTTAAIEKVRGAILADVPGVAAAPPAAPPKEVPLVKEPPSPPKPSQKEADRASQPTAAFDQSEALIGYWRAATAGADGKRDEDGVIIQLGDYNDPDILQISDPAGALGSKDPYIPVQGVVAKDGRIQLTMALLPGVTCTLDSAVLITCVNGPKIQKWNKVGGIPLAASADPDFALRSVWEGTSDNKPIRLDIVQNLGFAIGVVNQTNSYIHHLNGRIMEQRPQNDAARTSPHWGYLSANHNLFYTSLGETFKRVVNAPEANLPDGGYGCIECTSAADCPKGLACFGVKFDFGGQADGRCCF